MRVSGVMKTIAGKERSAGSANLYALLLLGFSKCILAFLLNFSCKPDNFADFGSFMK
jgi:hypothetical protein